MSLFASFRLPRRFVAVAALACASVLGASLSANASTATAPPAASLFYLAHASDPMNGGYGSFTMVLTNVGTAITPTHVYVGLGASQCDTNGLTGFPSTRGTYYAPTAKYATGAATAAGSWTLPPMKPGQNYTLGVSFPAHVAEAPTSCYWSAFVSGGGGVDIAPSGSEFGGFTIEAPDPVSTDVLDSGRDLDGGEAVTSENGQYQLRMQTDGNLVEYSNGRPIWNTHTQGNQADYAVMQSDNNLVVYSYTGSPLWNTGTHQNGFDDTLVLQDNGLLAMEDESSATPSWRAPGTDMPTLRAPSLLTSGQAIDSGKARLVVQPDGNVVDYVGARAVWNSHTVGSSGDDLELQADGNLVVEKGDTVLFESGTGTTGAGNVVSLSPTGVLTMSHGTKVVWRVG